MSLPAINPDAVLWSVPEEERAGRPLLLLLHGYGSNEADLFGLVPHLPEAPVIASLRAPLQAPWPIDGWSWFPLAVPGAPDPAGLDASVDAIIAWIDALPFTPTSVAAAGFSQGGAMSVHLLRRAPERFAFAGNLAGFVVAGDQPGDAILQETRPPVFWGRGSADTVISDEAVARTTDWLPDHSTLSGRIYEGLDHSISGPELADLRAFLDRQY
ncbi:alpha/beta hydrolase [Mycetocola saprophilus]|uniref:alpha/beta hydrolase n=1 Tax=Mycetocola saprophilus TaxID=76636 RepID=UPI0004BE6853|nr:alpha/beta hydrolase-fold protein [Mycetocola saprophilus]